MGFSEFWDYFNTEADPDRLMDAVHEVLSASRDAGADATAAAEAYYANAKAKAGKISSSIAELDEKLSKLEVEIGAIRYSLVEATANEDAGELDKVRGYLEPLVLKKHQIESEKALLLGAHVRGDEALYNDAAAKNSLFLELRKFAQEVMQMVSEKGLAKRYSEIENLCSNYSDAYIGATAGYGLDMKQLDNHFNSELRTERSLGPFEDGKPQLEPRGFVNVESFVSPADVDRILKAQERKRV